MTLASCLVTRTGLAEAEPLTRGARLRGEERGQGPPSGPPGHHPARRGIRYGSRRFTTGERRREADRLSCTMFARSPS